MFDQAADDSQVLAALRGESLIPEKYKKLNELAQLQLEDLARGGGNMENLENSHCIQEISKIIRKTKVYTEHAGRKLSYAAKKVTATFPQTYLMERQKPDGTVDKCTVDVYFMERYGIQLERFPMVIVEGKSGIAYLPLELCFLERNQSPPLPI